MKLGGMRSGESSGWKSGRWARASAWSATLGAGVLAAATLGGCGAGTSGLRMQGVRTAGELIFDPPLTVYRFADRNTADVYMTDLARELLDAEADLSGVSGQFTHIHLFVSPEAGKTPIADEASSATIRHVVIADGEVGVYGGGGFLFPRRRPGREVFRGSIEGATLRLVAKSPGFYDALGAVTMDATVRAPLDEPMADALAQRLSSLLARTSPIATPTPDSEPESPAPNSPADRTAEETPAGKNPPASEPPAPTPGG